MNGPIHQCEPPQNAVDALIHGDNPLAYAKRHEDLHGTSNDTDGSAGPEELGASATKLTPASMTHASRNCGSFDSATCDSSVNAVDRVGYLFDAAYILRSQRLRDLLAAISEWARASGPDRAWWRRDALWRLAEWRRLYAVPERRAFEAAIAASQHRRSRT